MTVSNFLKTACLGLLAVSGGAATSLVPANQAQLEKTQQVALRAFGNQLAPSASFICQDRSMIEWRDEFHRGGTGYIDGIHYNDLKEPVQCGIDSHGRAFMAMRYVCNVVKDQIKKVSYGAIAIFQRYSNSPTPIVSGGHFKPTDCPNAGPIDPIFNPDFATNIEKFLDGESLQYKDYFDSGVEKSIQLCDDDNCPEPTAMIGSPDMLEIPSREEL